jgi:hypothetical protein
MRQEMPEKARISLLLHPNIDWLIPYVCPKDSENARSELGRFAKNLTLFSQLETGPLPNSLFS